MTDFVPNPANYKMKGNKPVEAPETFQLPDIDSMTKEELIALIKRVSSPLWGIACMTKEQTAEAMLLKLASVALTTKDTKDMITAMREWLDRERGRPAQSLDMRGDIRHSFVPLVIKCINEQGTVIQGESTVLTNG